MRWWGPLCTRLVGFFSAGSLKQQSADRHVAPLGHIILIPSQPVFALSLSLILGGKATNTNFIISSLTRSGLESTIYRTRGEHTYHYTTDVVGFDLDTWTTLIDKKSHGLCLQIMIERRMLLLDKSNINEGQHNTIAWQWFQWVNDCCLTPFSGIFQLCNDDKLFFDVIMMIYAFY